jgi:hypothetical protein|tara:strand:- start:63 stop:296 length:234 start_codon:yes stop_codon:yes gene_type:complete
MDLTKIGLYVLAGYGAYAMYDKYMAKASSDDDTTTNFMGTSWQKGLQRGTDWQDYSNMVGTNWQREGFNNACGSCGA